MPLTETEQNQMENKTITKPLNKTYHVENTNQKEPSNQKRSKSSQWSTSKNRTKSKIKSSPGKNESIWKLPEYSWKYCPSLRQDGDPRHYTHQVQLVHKPNMTHKTSPLHKTISICLLYIPSNSNIIELELEDLIQQLPKPLILMGL